jgi:hypothetical protein
MQIFRNRTNKSSAYSNLCEECCVSFQLIFLLPLTSPEYSFFLHLSQHCARDPCLRLSSKLTVAPSAIITDTRTAIMKTFMPPVNLEFSSLPPYHTLLQAFVKSLKGICLAKQTKFYVRMMLCIFK